MIYEFIMFLDFEKGQYQYYKTRKREYARRSNLTSWELHIHSLHFKTSLLLKKMVVAREINKYPLPLNINE